MVDCTRRALVRNAGLAVTAGLSGCLSDSLLGGGGPEPVEPGDDRVDWKVAFDAPLRVRPALGDAVYVAAGQVGVGPNDDGETGPLAALDHRDGTVDWSEPLDSPPVDHPVPRVGECFLVTGDNTGLSGVDQRLHRYDEAGRETWQTEPIDQSTSLLAFGEDRAYLGTGDDAYGPTGQPLFGVSLADGSRAWEGESGDTTRGRYHYGLLLVDAAGVALAAHDPADGRQRWLHDGRPLVDARDRLVVEDGFAFVEPLDGGVRMVSLATGSAGWSLDDASGFSPTGGAAADGRLVVAGSDGRVFGLDPAEGIQRWRFQADARIRHEPLLAGGHAFVADRDGTIYALDADTGERLWQGSTSGSVGYLQRRGNAVVVQASTNSGSELVAFDAGDGTEQWRYGSSAELTRPAVGRERVFVVDESENAVLALG